MCTQAPRIHALFAAAVAVGGCAGPAGLPAPQVPAVLRLPAGQIVFLETLATGSQIYECAAKAAQPSAYEWTFRAPEATLVDGSGKVIGRHYAGPTWQSTADGSSVVGEVKARDPGPDASAIPWLLLTAKAVSGPGVFGVTQSIQRVRTVGGIAPLAACSAANAGQIAKVPYQATYYFYAAAGR